MASFVRLISAGFRDLFFLFLAFVYILNVTLDFSGFALSLGLLAVFVVFLFSLVRLRDFYFFVDSKFLLLVAGALSIGFYSALVEVVSLRVGFDFIFLKIVFYNLCYLFFSVFFSVILWGKGFDIYDLLRFVFYVSSINAIFILISFFFPDFRVFLESFLYQATDSNIDYAAVDWRLRGLASAGGASLSVFMGLSILAGVLAVEAKSLPVLTFVMSSGLILLSLMVVARTGMIYGLAILFFWFSSQFVRLELSRVFAFLVAIASCLILFFYFHEYFERVLPWAFELFNNILSGQGASTASTDDLASMLVIPSDPVGIVFGFGFFDGDISFRSDSGYLKTIFSIGLPLAVLLYLFYGYVFLRFVPRGLAVGRWYWFLGLMMFFVLEIKEPFFYQNYSARFLVLVAVFVAVQKGYRRLDESCSHHSRA